jgi:hypothetical protein
MGRGEFCGKGNCVMKTSVIYNHQLLIIRVIKLTDILEKARNTHERDGTLEQILGLEPEGRRIFKLIFSNRK